MNMMKCFTILEEIKSTLPKSLFYNYYSQIKSNQMSNIGFWWDGETLSWQSRERANSIHIWHQVRKSNPGHIGGRQVLSPPGQPCHNKQHTKLSSDNVSRSTHVPWGWDLLYASLAWESDILNPLSPLQLIETPIHLTINIKLV